MRIFRSLILAALAALPLVPMALAQNAGTSTSGGWVPRTALKPEPGQLVVPKGYKAEVFVAGLDTTSSAAVDREGNVWVAICGTLFGPFEYEYAGQRIKNPVSGPHVKVFDKDGKHLKDIGVGKFGFVMNAIGYCAENNKVYIPEYSKHIWEISGVNGGLKKILTDLPIGDHKIRGVPREDGYPPWGPGLPPHKTLTAPGDHRRTHGAS